MSMALGAKRLSNEERGKDDNRRRGGEKPGATSNKKGKLFPESTQGKEKLTDYCWYKTGVE